MSSGASPVPHNSDWSIQDEVNQLFALDLAKVKGTGPARFNEAPGQITAIRQALTVFSRQKWHRVSPELGAKLERNLGETLETVDGMLTIDPNVPWAGGRQQELRASLERLARWFESELFDEYLDAGADVLTPASAVSLDIAELRRQHDDLRATLAADRRRQEELRASIRELEPLVEAQRASVTASGSGELSDAYIAQADGHRRSWRAWLITLVCTIVAAGLLGAGVIAVVRPDRDASDAELLSALALELLAIGLLLYVVRLVAQQFRVHRHLEAVARNKAAALATFSRMVAGQSEPDVRAAIALALAQSVFVSIETGFIDSAGEHVTLVDRLVTPAVQRMKQ